MPDDRTENSILKNSISERERSDNRYSMKWVEKAAIGVATVITLAVLYAVLKLINL
jgi:hypothetical protein